MTFASGVLEKRLDMLNNSSGEKCKDVKSSDGSYSRISHVEKVEK